MKAAICFEFGKPLVVQEIGIDPPRAGEAIAAVKRGEALRNVIVF